MEASFSWESIEMTRLPNFKDNQDNEIMLLSF